MIQINADTRIASDSHNVIVQRRYLRTPKDESKAPYHEWANETFHRTLEQAYNSVGEAFVRELLANPHQQSLEALTTAWRDLWMDVSKIADGGVEP